MSKKKLPIIATEGYYTKKAPVRDMAIALSILYFGRSTTHYTGNPDLLQNCSLMPSSSFFYGRG
jgi:hypothetical protein